MDRSDPTKQPISFGRVYARSQTFRSLFQDGMTLVEETAAYLDGDGRSAAKDLGRPCAASTHGSLSTDLDASGS